MKSSKQKKNQKLIVSIILLLVLLLSACGPKATLAPEYEGEFPAVVAILPLEYPAGVRAERVDYIRQALYSELRSNGFLVLDEKLVNDICSKPECPERKELVKRYAVQTFAVLKLDSVSNYNFVLGYYNQIAGKLSFYDTSEKEILLIEHTERDRGGLIFNSGQVFQGVISQVESFGEDSDRRHEDLFVRNIIASAPKPLRAEVANPGLNVQITSAMAEMLEPGVQKICAAGSQGMLASYLSDGLHSTLREVSPGNYCGVFLLGVDKNSASDDAKQITKNLPKQMPRQMMVELRSPFGLSARKEIDINSVVECSIDGKVKLIARDGANQIRVICAKVGSEPPVNCSDAPTDCSKYSFLIYKSPSVRGPFLKVDQVRNANWTDTSVLSKTKTRGDEAFYVVVAVHENGTQSLPVTAETIINDGI